MEEAGKVLRPERQIAFPTVMVWVTGGLFSVDGDWKTEGPGRLVSQSPPDQGLI